MKAYIIPQTLVVLLKMRDGVLNTTSMQIYGDTTSTQYVKEDVTNSSSSNNYNVWDDDWSK